MIQQSLIAAFVLGLFGGGHCLGMCGGIVAALSFALPQANNAWRVMLLVLYNIGRITSYMAIGALAGLAAGFFASDGLPVLRVVAGILLILMGVYLAGWWNGLARLEKAGAGVWRILQPISRRLIPVRSATAALLLGMMWGWLPCGLVYSALAYGTVQGSWYGSAAVMLAFGLGTLPAVLLGGLAGMALNRRITLLLRQRMVRTLVALAYILFGVWTIWAVLDISHAEHEAGHDHSPHVLLH